MISKEATVPEIISQSSASPNVTPNKRAQQEGQPAEDLDLIAYGDSDEEDQNKYGYLVFDDKEIANSLLSSAGKT